MKKINFLFVFFFSVSINLTAQISFPSDSLYMLIKGPDMDGNGDSSSDLYNFFTNESSNRKEFRWIKKEIEVTSPRWQFSVCDDNACWFAPIDSADVVVNGNTES